MDNLTAEEIANLKRQIEQRLNTEDIVLNFRKSIEGKNITICLGNTRNGKSTLINYLIGNRLRSVPRENLARQFQLELWGEDGGPAIGHGSLSVTDLPDVYRNPTDSNGVLIDSPGFEDNRGIPQDIFNALCVNQIRFAKSVKFVLVSFIGDVINDNVRNITSLMSQMTYLVTNIENIPRSVSIIFTKDNFNYTPEELRASMNRILNERGMDIPRSLLRNLTANSRLIGVFKMPAEAGAVNLNDLDVNIKDAINACEQVPVNRLDIKFALADRTNVFLKKVYPEYTDTQYFVAEVHRTVDDYAQYFDIDLYVFASFKEELDEVNAILAKMKSSLNSEIRRDIRNLDNLKTSLETLLEVRELVLSNNLKTSFKFILSLDNALLFEESSRRNVLQSYKKCLESFLKKVQNLKTKIDDELELRKKCGILNLYNTSLFTAGGIAPTLRILRYVQSLVPESTIYGSTLYDSFVGLVGSTAATATVVVGGVVVSGVIGGTYILYKERISKRHAARCAQGRQGSGNFN